MLTVFRFIHLLHSHSREDTERFPSLPPQCFGVIRHCVQVEAQLHSSDLGPCYIMERDQSLSIFCDVHTSSLHPERASWPDEADLLPHSASRGPNSSLCRYVKFLYVVAAANLCRLLQSRMGSRNRQCQRPTHAPKRLPAEG